MSEWDNMLKSMFHNSVYKEILQDQLCSSQYPTREREREVQYTCILENVLQNICQSSNVVLCVILSKSAVFLIMSCYVTMNISRCQNSACIISYEPAIGFLPALKTQTPAHTLALLLHGTRHLLVTVCLPHVSRRVTEFYNQLYPHCSLSGQFGPQACIVRLSDLTPLDYFLMGGACLHMKSYRQKKSCWQLTMGSAHHIRENDEIMGEARNSQLMSFHVMQYDKTCIIKFSVMTVDRH
jgi:hypothetical protein